MCGMSEVTGFTVVLINSQTIGCADIQDARISVFMGEGDGGYFNFINMSTQVYSQQNNKMMFHICLFRSSTIHNNGPDLSIVHRYLVAKFMDSHSTNILAVMIARSLFKDDQQLLADKREAMTNRQFRTSKLMPYSTSLEVFCMPVTHVMISHCGPLC